MKLEYTRPELEVTLFAIEDAIMDSAIEVIDDAPAAIPADTWAQNG